MIVARLFPKTSSNYKNFQPFFQRLGDKMDSGLGSIIFSVGTDCGGSCLKYGF